MGPQKNVFIVFSEIKDLPGQGMRKNELKYQNRFFKGTHTKSQILRLELKMVKADSSFKMPITFKLHLKM